MKTPFDYTTSINPTSFVICGLELKPFSLGHYIILQELDNPFLTDDPNANINLEAGLYQFFLCLIICAQSYEDNVKLLNNDKQMKKLCDKFTKNLLKSMKKESDWNIYSKIQLFKEYISEFTQMPIFQVENTKESAPSGIDWKQNLFTVAKSEFGYQELEILNMPLKRLFYEWCSFAENNGAIRVQNEYEMQMIKELKNSKNNTNTQTT